MATVLWAVKGPRLIRLLRHENNEGRDYVPNFLEAGGDKFIKVMQTCWSVSWWSSPILMTVLYRRDYFSHAGLLTIAKFLCSVGIIYASAYCIRGLGRLTNPDYMVFINILVQAIRSPTVINRQPLQRYDFEFWAWPVDFKWNEASESKSDRVGRTKIQVHEYRNQNSSVLTTLPCTILSYIAMHTFGRRMVYPGATSLMQMLVGNMLDQGRAALVEQKGGVRGKVLTEDNNEIDTMFVDRRGPGTTNGHTLVVCFEGNAGFYEMGCSGTPMDCGYSVLGWNHPGFGGSSGIPLPAAEQNAVDAVMQYAIERLGFPPERIVLFAWSIGGYSASWAAMNYPDIKFVILDATFDDIVPLAVTKMPQSWRSLVTMSLRTYMNLNIAEQLYKYPGPVKLIRRTKDEIITTEQGEIKIRGSRTVQGLTPILASNRGNVLLAKLLQYRYPKLMDSVSTDLLMQWLSVSRSQQDNMLMEHRVNSEDCAEKFNTYTRDVSSTYPMHIGGGYSQALKNQMVLFLAQKYLQDFDSTHCTPLPASFFTPAWSPEQ